MSKLNNLKKAVKPTAYLEDVHFDGEGAHIAMTTDAGACSLMNDSFLMKGLEESDLTEDQLYILREIGEIEDNESIEKATALDNDNTGVTNEKTEETMSKELEGQVQILTKKLAVADNKEVIAKYELEAELNKELAEALVDVDTAIIVKAMDVLVARTEEAIVKAKADAEALIEKAKDVTETDLQKELSAEAGEAGEVEEVVEKSQKEIIAEQTAAAVAAKKGAK